MPAPDYRITDQQSFEQVVKEPRQVAGLYFFQLMDTLVGLTYLISADFRKRPQLYGGLGQTIASALARLNAQYGTEINVLSKRQRYGIYLPIFGSLKSDSFPHLRDDLFRSATAFAEHADDAGISILRESFRTSLRPFKDYLLTLHGDSVRVSEESLFDMNEKLCYPVLRHPELAAVFGVTKLANVEYPYATNPAQDLLVEEAFKQLTQSNSITRQRISMLQRVALRGAEAIATALDFEERDSDVSDLDLLISKCYVWGKSFKSW